MLISTHLNERNSGELVTTHDQDVTVTVWNVNSLSVPSKTVSIFDRTDKEKSNLQIFIDTRTSTDNESRYQKLTQHKLHFNSFKPNARGIVILKKDSCPAKNVSTSNIITGNLTKVTFMFEDESYAIMALYGPRNDEVSFFQSVLDPKHSQGYDHFSYVGDWNIVLDQVMDTSGYLHENHLKSCQFVKDCMV